MDDFFNLTENAMPRIGEQAPAFRSVTTQGTIYFPSDYVGKWVILFSYSDDFTHVSTSEIMPGDTMYDDLKALNCELVGLSVDGLRSHLPQLSSIKEKTEYKGMKAAEIKFPLIEDNPMEVARKYGMIQPGGNNTKTVRAVFFIDPECMIRAIIYYPLSLGINYNELKRVIVALQTEDQAISLPAKSLGIAIERIETKKESKKHQEWFYCTKELSEEKMMNLN